MKFKFVISLFCLVIWKFSNTEAQLQYARVDSLTDALKYLVKFGYLKDLSEVASLLKPSFTSFDPWSPASSAMRIAFQKFQQYAKLPVTGEFDDATKSKMNTPRCGNKDIIQINTVLDVNSLLRRRRFVAGSFRWQRRELTYRVSKFSDSGFSREITMREVDTAFQLWGNVTNLHFVRVDSTTTADVDLRFARGPHGDIEPFDGRGITLAHAFPPGPEIGGDIHFDDDEEWTSKDFEGTNFLHVVVHELGHALGLRHSDVEEAIMYAFVRPYEPNLRLHQDDIEGIQSMYGERETTPGTRTDSTTPTTTSTSSTTRETTTTTTSTSTSTTLPPPIEYPSEITDPVSEEVDYETTTAVLPSDNDVVPDICSDPKVDAITALADGSVYAFRENYAFKVDPNGGGIMKGSIDLIPYVFYTLPGPIDAALTYNGKTYFFKGMEYWRFVNRKLDGDFPRLISDEFPGIPDFLDAAFTWSEDNLMYFFKGDKYWAFNPDRKIPVEKKYPLPISQWYGLPTKNLDAAFTSPTGPTYFFQNDNYWLFYNDNFQVAETNPPYPQSVKEMWLGCTSYRPEPEEMKRGFISKAFGAVKDVVKGVAGHVGYNIKKIKGWLG